MKSTKTVDVKKSGSKDFREKDAKAETSKPSFMRTNTKPKCKNA
jgi:hypothetical protein